MKIELNSEQEKFIANLCREYNSDPDELLTILNRAQEYFGYLPPEVQARIAKNMNIDPDTVVKIVDEYTIFRTVPQAEYPIRVCTGNTCRRQGGLDTLRKFGSELHLNPGETSSDGLFSLDTVKCTGTCGLAPVVLIGQKFHDKITPEKVGQVIELHRTLKEQKDTL